jgi:hypothetical protein
VAGARGADGPRGLTGAAGRDGADGVGIAFVEQRSDTTFTIALTDDSEFEIELPKPRFASGGGGGGGGIHTITSQDNSISITVVGNTVDLSVVGGGGPTATRLSDLQDVAISEIADGNVLSYKTSLNKWRNEARKNLVDGGNF